MDSGYLAAVRRRLTGRGPPAPPDRLFDLMQAPALVAATAAPSSTTTDGAVAIGVTVVATLVVVALLLAAAAMVRNARALRRAADELRQKSLALVAELERTVARADAEMDKTVARADAEMDRVDDLIGSAERLTDTVGSASQMAYSAVANPVIKVMALGAGTARASERIRRRANRR